MWYPKSLKCQIYENGVPLDLNMCTDTELEDLADAIIVHWKTPENSAIWFNTAIYEKHSWFKPSKNSIEIECFKFDLYTESRTRQLDISKLYIDKMIGKRFKISPKNTLMRKWLNAEVMFVA